MPVKKLLPRKRKMTAVEKIDEISVPEMTEAPSVSRKYPVKMILVILVILVLAYFGKSLLVVALVNNRPIFRLSLIRELEKQGGKSTLDSMVTKNLVFQEAQKQKISVTDAEVDTAVKDLGDNLKKQGQDLNSVLLAQRMTIADVRMQIKLQKIIEKILGKDVVVSETEVKDYLSQNSGFLSKDLTGEEASKAAAEQLKQQKIQTQLSAWIETLKKNAKINYFLQF